jgi:protein MpaA
MNILKSATTQLGNKIELIGTPSENNVLIIGVFHGDESQGKYLIEKYLDNYEYNNLLFIPCLNPDGLQNGTRTNANGVDLNRNFPTKNFGQDGSQAGDNPQDYYGGISPASETETQFVIDVIEKYQPKIVLTLHAPYKIVNYDGPAKEIAQKISDIIGYPVEESIGYPTPGSFGTYCGVECNIPVITLELDEKIPVTQLEQPIFRIFNELL